MKKLAIIAILATATGLASAADIGARFEHNSGNDTSGFGVTVGQKFGAVGVEAAVDRSAVASRDVNRYSLVGSYDLTKVYGVTVAAKAGVAFVDALGQKHGGALLGGVGVSYPVTKKISLVADYAYQQGQERVSEWNGNTVSAGLKYSF